MTSPCTSDQSIDNLIAKALRLISGRTARERALAEVFKNYQAQFQERRPGRHRVITGGTPHEVVDALRAPVGVDRVVTVYDNGVVIRAVLHPHGRPDLEREAAVWQCLRAQADAKRGDRK